MAKGDKVKRVLAFTGAAAFIAIAVNLLVSVINAHKDKWRKKKRGLLRSNVCVNLSAFEIHHLTDRIIAKSNEIHDLVASVHLENVSYENAVAPLADLEEFQYPLVQSCIFQKMVATSDEVRKASADAERILDSHFLMCRKREDVYRVIKAYDKKGEWLGPEAKRYVQSLVKDFERNGAGLTSSKRKEIESLSSQIEKLSLEFIQNLNNDNGFLFFSEAELPGMPSRFIESLDKSEQGKLKVFLKSHHVLPILEYCKIGSTRKSVAIAYCQRHGRENLAILKHLVHLRHKYAQLLGYSNYADYVTEPRMAKTSSKVFEFLEELSNNLSDLATTELNFLKDLKMKEEGDASFGMEDLAYYIKRAEELHYNLDMAEVRQYFPVNLVFSGIFKLLEDIFGLTFKEVKDVEVWHETVKLYAVLEFSSNDLLGYVYLDIFSRHGKFTHTCVLSLQNGSSSSKGIEQIPVTLLISHCPKQFDECPALLRFSDVICLFHEFTHVVHHICNRAAFSRFSGLNVEGDFVEMPSHLLENWCYENLSLKMMSGFHKDITKSITTEICKSLKKKRDLFSGLKLKQEVLTCLFDQIIHSRDNIDIVELLRHLHPKIMLGIPLLEGTNPASCLPRSAICYDATCYSQIWSEVFAADLFATKFQDDLLNLHAGLQFKKKAGGYREPFDILSDYLGRKPSIRPFVEIKARNSLPLAEIN
ncbi:probable thimet oligopeptidase isoform X2 [Phalaenopsis equestris]|uniref:probable thimet oligopeptidase isoform X2 n=1 Tax=Phalaenopsis equestris TaxID=78828 RepID=UPI0009E43360|nr:probable thimet oligopeptidase isoform X2 [Phalaenopsis equestris]